MPDKSSQIQSLPQAKEYHKIKNFLFVVNLLISIGLFLFFAVSGLSIFLRAYLKMFFENTLILNGLFFIIFYSVISIFGFPLELYEDFILEHQFKLSKQYFFGWFKDYIKKIAITFLLVLIIVECVYKFIGLFYNNWWIFASILWLVITVFFAKVFPVIILPLFFKSHHLSEGVLKDRLGNLAKKFNFRLSDILVLELSKKTIKANALVAGIGNTKRIYLSDTLLNDFSNDEIEVIIAHELTHDKNKDIYKNIIVAFAVSLICFYLCDLFLSRSLEYFGYFGKDDIANLPIFSLLISSVGLIALPFQNSYSRFLEKNADIGSIKTTDKANDFILMITKLGHKNLAEFSPNRIVEIFLYDHLPISKRINLAKQFLKTEHN